MPNKKTIGILGGMGPEATVDIFNWIVKLTPAKDDSDHIRILIDNNPQVPNRLEALLNHGPSPLPILIKMAKNLESIGADFLIIPCNTASYYTRGIQEQVKIPVLNIVAETANYIFKHKPNNSKIGLMGTNATITLGLYDEALGSNSATNNSDKHFEVIKLPDDDQNRLVQQSISGPNSIKAGNFTDSKYMLTKASRILEEKGSDCIIMGCTELPLALSQEDVSVELINPTKILAQRSVNIALGIEQI